MGLAFILLLGPLERRIELVHENDFSGFWAGARALVIGADPYDAATWRATVARLGTQAPDTAVYGYVPWVALALVPLALVPLEVAGWIWMVATVFAAALVLRALLRSLVPGLAAVHLAFGLALLGAQPGYHALVLGQWSFALLAAVGAAILALRAGHPARAGLAALAFLAKPQLFVFTAIRLAAERGVARVAIPAGALIVLVATLLLPQWLGAWTAEVAPARVARNATIPVALADLLGPVGTYVGYAVILAGAVLATRFGLHGDASLAVWLALSSAGAIYTWSYDHLLLLIPIVLAGSVLLARRGARGATVITIGTLAILVIVSPVFYALAVARHRESFSAVLPVVVFAVLVIALWPYRRSVAS